MDDAGTTTCDSTRANPARWTNPATYETARRYAIDAAKSKLALFIPWPSVSLDDLVQVALQGIYTARYDVTRSAWGTFCYRVARCRILDFRDSLVCRGVAVRLPETITAPTASTPGHAPVLEDLLDAAESIPRPFAGRRGRPWKYTLAQRLDILQRRGRGESWGSIALQIPGASRESVRRAHDSVCKFRSRMAAVLN